MKYDPNLFIWGSYRHKQHLFPGTICVVSWCGSAYCGDAGLNTESKAPRCKKCEQIEQRELAKK